LNRGVELPAADKVRLCYRVVSSLGMPLTLVHIKISAIRLESLTLTDTECRAVNPDEGRGGRVHPRASATRVQEAVASASTLSGDAPSSGHAPAAGNAEWDYIFRTAIANVLVRNNADDTGWYSDSDADRELTNRTIPPTP
jgi:hypothetical protein